MHILHESVLYHPRNLKFVAEGNHLPKKKFFCNTLWQLRLTRPDRPHERGSTCRNRQRRISPTEEWTRRGSSGFTVNRVHPIPPAIHRRIAADWNFSTRRARPHGGSHPFRTVHGHPSCHPRASKLSSKLSSEYIISMLHNEVSPFSIWKTNAPWVRTSRLTTETGLPIMKRMTDALSRCKFNRGADVSLSHRNSSWLGFSFLNGGRIGEEHPAVIRFDRTKPGACLLCLCQARARFSFLLSLVINVFFTSHEFTQFMNSLHSWIHSLAHRAFQFFISRQECEAGARTVQVEAREFVLCPKSKRTRWIVWKEALDLDLERRVRPNSSRIPRGFLAEFEEIGILRKRRQFFQRKHWDYGRVCYQIANHHEYREGTKESRSSLRENQEERAARSLRGVSGNRTPMTSHRMNWVNESSLPEKQWRTEKWSFFIFFGLESHRNSPVRRTPPGTSFCTGQHDILHIDRVILEADHWISASKSQLFLLIDYQIQ